MGRITVDGTQYQFSCKKEIVDIQEKSQPFSGKQMKMADFFRRIKDKYVSLRHICETY